MCKHIGTPFLIIVIFLPLLPSWISSIKQISISCRSFLTATFQFCYFGLGPKADFPCFYFAKIERETKGEYDEKNRTSNLIHWFVFLTSVRGESCCTLTEHRERWQEF